MGENQKGLSGYAIDRIVSDGKLPGFHGPLEIGAIGHVQRTHKGDRADDQVPGAVHHDDIGQPPHFRQDIPEKSFTTRPIPFLEFLGDGEMGQQLPGFIHLVREIVDHQFNLAICISPGIIKGVLPT
ncbi:MAG: hypothetical protein QME89_12680, partial [Actinomycetota bacterium]|nr:hypothetical protein [Actinomycetota bacterium]